MEIGMGIHGEPGIDESPLLTANETADLMLEKLTADAPLHAGDEVSVMVNGLGATPLEELPESVGSADTPEELIGAREEARQIQAILHDLLEPYREVFMWRVYAELSYKQIGELFAKSDNWACVTYHRARNMIKNRLEDSNNEK